MTQIITTSSTTAGINITAAANEFVYIGAGTTRASSSNNALASSTGGANIQVLGNLAGAVNGMILSDTADPTGNFDVTIGAGGSVFGASIGIRFAENNNRLVNNGTISGRLEGVLNDQGDNFSLNNSGIISSSGADGVYNNQGADFLLSNSGTISSSGRFAVESFLGANFSVINSGTISSSNYTAVSSGGTGGQIINHGIIESAGTNAVNYGVEIYDNESTVAVAVFNYGTISAMGGTVIFGDIDDEDEIHNFGTLVGNVVNGGGVDIVENGGLIQGDVELGDGADSYIGEGGRVTGFISGGAGDDDFAGGKWADRFFGGVGVDTVDYSTSLGGVQINLQTGAASSFDAAGDTLSSIENLKGSSGDDYLAGDTNTNQLDGQAGNDSLYGRVGADTLNGGAGNDRLFGGMDADILNGGFDDDLLVGGAGADNIDGGDGFDTADYSASSGAVTMNLDTNTHSGGDATGDFLTSVEAVIGSAFADDIAGSHADNVMEGGKGQDRLQGRWGADDLRGGGGNDRLYGGVDNDKLNGGTGNDKLYGGGGDDLFIFEDSFGNDKVMDFSNGSEMLDVSAVTGATTATFHVSGGGASNVMVDFGGPDSIEFVGITNAALITVDDFIF